MPAASKSSAPTLRVVGQNKASSRRGDAARALQRQAWLWALAKKASDGVLPSGKAIAAAYGRHERLVKSQGEAGALGRTEARKEPHSENSPAEVT